MPRSKGILRPIQQTVMLGLSINCRHLVMLADDLIKALQRWKGKCKCCYASKMYVVLLVTR